jgi:hypothetical protein
MKTHEDVANLFNRMADAAADENYHRESAAARRWLVAMTRADVTPEQQYLILEDIGTFVR